MNAWLCAQSVFITQMTGWFCGRLLRRRLPVEHLASHTRDSVVLAVGMVATLSALVLGLMISSAKTSFDADRTSMVEMATDILLIDRALSHYGDDAKPARELLRGLMQRAVDEVTGANEAPTKSSGQPQPPLPQMGRLQISLLALAPVTDGQRWLQARALTVTGNLERTRVLFAERANGSIPLAFLVVLTAWLSMLYLAFAVFAPPNATANVAAVGGSIAFSAAIFLILELDTSIDGLIRVSGEPLIKTLELLGR